ncbi:MAG: class I SAM-dependent methyltransferase [Chloroflexi bacterium]|nr:class I SAM-dependent methyltransferase [Chloroflexota bacterium]
MTGNLSHDSQPNDHNEQGSSSQRMFGSQASFYATSQVHISDSRLTTLQRLVAEQPNPGWAIDLGTGAGFTAFAASEYCQRVVASDITLEMLKETRRIGNERQLENVLLCQNQAEQLPFRDESLDLITCRAAGHHFTDLGKAFDEMRRVLKTGGSLIMADSVSPEDDGLAKWYNDMELRRDYSHVLNRKVSVLLEMLEGRGLRVLEKHDEKTHMMFNDWVERTATPEAEVATLRRDFLGSTAEARQVFLIEEKGDDIAFAWPSLVFRAVKE